MKTPDGVFLLYKPKGISSFEFLLRARKILKAEKIGHAGTLDRNASGLMIVLVGRATKEADKYKGMDKEYIGTIKFHGEVEIGKIENIFKSMGGKNIVQTPPLKSAVARKARERKIYFLKIISLDRRNLRFSISCGAGFYVRRFASDLGDKVGVKAHLAELKRTKIGDFDVSECLMLEELPRRLI